MKLVEVGDICRFEYGKSLPEKTRAPGQFPVYGSNGSVGSHTASFTQGKTIVIGRKGSIGEVHISSDACWPIDTTYFIDKTCSDCFLRPVTVYDLRPLMSRGNFASSDFS